MNHVHLQTPSPFSIGEFPHIGLATITTRTASKARALSDSRYKAGK